MEIIPARKQGADAQAMADNSGSRLPLPSDTGRTIRRGMLLLVLGFGSFLVWALWAPLDEGVPAPGTVIVETNRKLVQHQTGGVVKEILVKEAQAVKAGEPLLKLDDTYARSNYESALQNHFFLQGMEARLLAEQGGLREVRFEDSLLGANHPKAAEHVASQRRLFVSRRATLAAQVAVNEEQATAAQAQAAGLEEQLRFMRPQLEGMRELAAEGYAPRNRQFDLERQFSDLQANALRARSAVAESKLRVIQLRQNFQREVETDLANAKRERAQNEEKLRALREELDRTVIKAPTDGAVNGLTAHTVGGVVAPGARLMDIVPAGDSLIVEARVVTHMVDRVQAGLAADINFHNFVNVTDMVIPGRVITVSADLMAPTQPNEPPYYLARVAVTPEGMKKLGKHQLQPGMPADVVIKSGERSLMQYLLKPLLRRMQMALTEA
jgi:protease secretion system membrane fusion protein